jgi:hypothetical protein
MRPMTSRISSLGCVCLGLLGLLASCGRGDEAAPPDGDERFEVALTAIPASTSCVRFTSVGGGRTWAQDFNVTGLANLTAQVRGLPANLALSVSADAYAVACTSITPTTQATWASLPVAVTLLPGVVPTVSFLLRPAGGVSGDVDFLFLAATPTTRTYPSTVVGQTAAAATYTIQNIGPAPTGVLSASFIGTGTTQFAIVAATNGCGVSLSVNATCTLQVTFTPTTAGAKAATLVLTGAPGGTIGIPLTGTGLQPAVLAVTPTTQDYGTVGVGLASPAVTYTVKNTGGTTTAPVALTSSDAAFVVSGSTCDVLALNQTCTFNVTFRPSAIATKSATLTATAGTATATATVTGNGVAAPALTLTPSTLAFGTVVLGETKQMPIMVKNVGGLPLTSFSAFVGGVNGSGPFIIDDRMCSMGPSLAPGATCAINVTLAPDPNNTGFNTAVSTTLLVTTAGANPTSVMGTASGLETWQLSPSPQSVDFGPVKIGTFAAQTIRFTNVAAAAVGPLTFSVYPAVYTITSNQCVGNFQLAPGGFCDVVVRYTPTAQMSNLGAVSVTGTNATVSSSLHGSGTP